MEEILEWESEANSIIRDIKSHVESIELSQKHKIDDGAYLNLTTLEDSQFCVLLNTFGNFQVSCTFDFSLYKANFVF